MQMLRQSTAVTLLIGPFLDDGDGKTAETGLTISQADVRLSKNGGNMAQKGNATSCTHDELGYYTCPLSTTDTGTLGILKVMVHESGALPVWHEYTVVPAAVYDSLVLGTDYLPVDAVQISSDGTAADNAELMFDGTGYAGGTTKLQVNTTLIEGSDATNQIRDSVVDDATRIDASALNTLSGHDPGATLGTADPGDAMTLTAAYDAAKTAAAAGAKMDLVDAPNATAVAAIQAGLSTLTAQQVWEYGTRSLSTFGTLVADTATAVWGAVARTITGGTVTTNSDKTGYTLTGDYDAAKTAAAAGAKMDLVDAPNATAVTAIQNGLAATGEAATAVGGLHDFDPTSETVDVGAVAGAAVVGVNDFKADVSGLALTGEAAAAVGTLNDLSAADVEDAVWDATLADHDDAGSTGLALAGAGDPWGTALPGAYGDGTAGKILGTNLDAAISTRSTLTAQQVWEYGTRSLSTFGTLVADVATAVWGAVARTITGGTVTTNSDKTGYTLTAAYDAAKTAAQAGDEMDLIDAPNATAVAAIQAGLAATGEAAAAVGTLNDFDPALDVVAHVTLVDTTTTNTDMRGTDNAALAATALTNATWTDARAGKIDNLDATVASREASGAAAAAVAGLNDFDPSADTVDIGAVAGVAVTGVNDFKADVSGLALTGEAATAVATLNDLSAQDVRDAMKLAPSAGVPAAGSVDLELDTIAIDVAGLDGDAMRGTDGAELAGAAAAAVATLNDFDPSSDTVDIGAVAGVAVTGVDDFKADVSGLALTGEAAAAVGTLHDFDPSSETVDVGAVAGVAVVGVDDFKADVSGLAATGEAATAVGTLNDLAAQDVRDAMKLAPSAGVPAADSIDAELDTIAADVAGLDGDAMRGTDGAELSGAAAAAVGTLHDFDPSAETVDVGAVAGVAVIGVDDFKADVSGLALTGEAAAAVGGLHDFDPSSESVNVGAVAGGAVTGVDDFKADVSGLALTGEAAAAVGGLHDFDPSSESVNVGAVAGGAVTGVDDFKADVSGLALTGEAAAAVVGLALTGEAASAVSGLHDFDPGSEAVNVGAVAGGVVSGVDDFKADVSGLALTGEAAAAVGTLNDLSAADVEDAVWDAATADHTDAGSMGVAVSGAGDPWSTVLPGLYGAGTAGRLVGDNIDAKISTRSTLTAAQVWAAGSRTLTGFGTLVADVATAVWTAVARTITGGTVTTVGDKTGYALTAAYDAAQTAAQAADLATVAADVLRTLGLAQENQHIDNVTTDISGRMTSARMRTYSAAGSVGTDSDVLATYTITATYTGAEEAPTTYSVVRV